MAENGYNWMETKFEETVVMSPYLLAMVVSDFQCIRGEAKPILSKSISVSSCARPDALNQLQFSLDAAIKSLEGFEAYFNVKYPLEKVDQVAVPDFAFRKPQINFIIIIIM